MPVSLIHNTFHHFVINADEENVIALSHNGFDNK